MSGFTQGQMTYHIPSTSPGYLRIEGKDGNTLMAASHFDRPILNEICRRWNSHAELVEALACEKALGEGNFEVLSKYGYDGPRLFVRAAAFCDRKTEAALAKVGASHA